MKDTNPKELCKTTSRLGDVYFYQGISIAIYIVSAVIIAVLMCLDIYVPLRLAVTAMCLGSAGMRIYVFMNWDKIFSAEEIHTTGIKIYFFTTFLELFAALAIWMM